MNNTTSPISPQNNNTNTTLGKADAFDFTHLVEEGNERFIQRWGRPMLVEIKVKIDGSRPYLYPWDFMLDLEMMYNTEDFESVTATNELGFMRDWFFAVLARPHQAEVGFNLDFLQVMTLQTAYDLVKQQRATDTFDIAKVQRVAGEQYPRYYFSGTTASVKTICSVDIQTRDVQCQSDRLARPLRPEDTGVIATT